MHDLPSESKRYLSCEVTTLEGGTGPDVTISTSTLKLLAAMEVDLSIDSYFLGADE